MTEFSLLVSIAIALFVVGIATLVVGCVLMMPKVGRHWWQGLIPGYNFYCLFRGARCEVLFAAYIIDAAFVFGFFFAEEPEVQGLVWWPVLIGVVMFQWMALCLAQRMHLNWFWQLLSFVAPSFAFCLIGLLPRRVDPDWYPWAVRPFIRFEHAIWTHDWEYDPTDPRVQLLDDEPEEEPSDDEFEDEEASVPEDFEPEPDVDPEPENLELEDLEPGDERELEPEPEDELGPESERTSGRRSDPSEPDEDPEDLDSDDKAQLAAPGEVADLPDSNLEPVEPQDKGNSEEEIPSEGRIMSEYEPEEPKVTESAEPEDPPAEDRYEGEPAYQGHGFDPEGDEAVERADEREPSAFSTHVERILDEEAALFDRKPRSTMRHGRPDDDLSDLVESQIEGVYAEQLGYPGVTQDVDSEEAAYLEENATYARERVLEETHDEPDSDGYVGKHLAAAVEQVEQEEASDPDWPEPERPEPERTTANRHIESRLPDID